ncbi:hypothetical protein PNEG_02319 [Pneumocystis murina B123]|uniref:Uncharacterized protein n=1 Tax=Pneumocystis murina (strain B123) TaxID=1069680 RepID=M7P688_PNEMU|nr:hypothetical protein PNEG_02319 [Pneumocystis murina B123]EMR09370.1 hypothetical protein PNEG_02319 [Pneumocystis murina B123]
MRFNFILSGVLALASLVSAALNVASQQVSEFSLKELVDLEVHRIPYSHLDLVLVCFYKGGLDDLYTIKQGLSFSASLNSKVRIAHISRKCDSFFLKVLAYDECDNLFVYFSSGFSVSVSGRVEYHRECVPAKVVQPSQTTKPVPQLTDASTSTSDTLCDETPTKTEVKVPTKTYEGQEQLIPSRSVPLPSTRKTEPIETLTSATHSQTSATDVKPTRKPDDIDNSGSVLTFKLFGTLFAVLVIFLCS